MIRGRRGSAFIWLAALTALAVVGLAYLTQTIMFNGVIGAVNTSSFTASQNTTWLQFQTVWNWWPALMLLGIVIWAIMRTLREDVTGGFR